MPRPATVAEITIEKLVHGGQGIGVLENGKKALVWGVLPGERVSFAVTKKRKDYVEGVVREVIEASPERVAPVDDLYLSTSPWQIMSYDHENMHKENILRETMDRAEVVSHEPVKFHALPQELHYRNKMEYSFYGNDDGLHLALFNRGTHQKQTVKGSSLARPEIDAAAQKICAILADNGVRAGDLKSLVVRCDQSGQCVASLYVRDENFAVIEALESAIKGVIVVYSNPKSPASVRTKDLYKYGDISLTDTLLSKSISYDVFCFFQGNLPIFQESLEKISAAIGAHAAIDMYSGVGAIGLSLPQTDILVESDASNVVWARKNTGTPRLAEVIHAASERALEYIESERALIVDPPRAGLHKDLITRINNVKPPVIAYLSCNPSTQARDLAALSEQYKVVSIDGYNFFPRTPHIESLAILERI